MRTVNLIAALLLVALTLCAPADAQNHVCPTASPGTSDNQCASTAFVAGAITPITTAQMANQFFAGPASGPSATPAFRSMVSADLNAISSPAMTNGWSFAPTSSANPAVTVAPLSSSLGQGFNISQSTGTSSGPTADVNLNLIAVTDGAAATNNNNYNFSAFRINDTVGGSSLTGARVGLYSSINFTATSASGNTSNTYTSATTLAQASANDNGGSGTEKGALFGFGTGAYLHSGATHWLNLSAYEVGFAAETGSSVNYKFGVNVVPFPTDAVHANNYEAGYGLSANAGAVGLRWGWLAHDGNGQTPLLSSGTLFGVAGTQTAAYGIDLSNGGTNTWTFSSYAWRSPGSSIDGSGNIRGVGVGVGTTVGGFGYGEILSVDGGIAFGTPSSIGGYLGLSSTTVHIGSITSNQVSLIVGNTEYFTINTSGNSTAAGTLTVAGIASAAQADVVCTTSAGLLTYQVSATGCASSSERFKNMLPSLTKAEVTHLARCLTETKRWTYKDPDFGDPSEYVGFTAEQVAACDDRFITRDDKGLPYAVKHQQLAEALSVGFAYLIAAVKADNDNLHREVEQIKRRL
jgi:hypothetical protein